MPEWLNNEVIATLLVETPVALVALFAMWCMMHGLIKALNVIVKLADAILDKVESRQETA